MKPIDIKVKRISDTACLPVKKYETDYCYDLTADSVEEIAPNVYKYSVNLAFQIDRQSCPELEDYLLDIDARPRSSIYKTGMILANCVPTIDENYTGNVQMIFYHIFPNMPKYEVGDRICQIKLGFTPKHIFTEVEELSTTDRGDGGFGSTGR